MDSFKMSRASKTDEHLRSILRCCLVAIENSIKRMRWEALEELHISEKARSPSCEICNQADHCSMDYAISAGNFPCIQDGCMEMEGCVPPSPTSPTQPSSPLRPTRKKLDVPQTIMDIDYDLINSGIAILPGCRDNHGGVVVLIFTTCSLWQNQQIQSSELARLLLYYFSISREETLSKGFTIFADIRGATSSIVNNLLESLYLFEENIPGSLTIVHLLCDHGTQSLVFRSPVYDSQARFKLDLLLSPDVLRKFISLDQLPSALDGRFSYHHEEWVRFHMKLEPFVVNCRTVAKYIIGVMQDLSNASSVPKTSKDASQMIVIHERCIQSAFNDPRVVTFQNEGEALINSLKKEEVTLGHTEDYRDAMENVRQLYKQLQDTMVKLVKLSNVRLCKLEQCQQLREFEEECSKIISWVSGDGGDLLNHHTVLNDNLKGVRSQQKSFDKVYFSAMTHIEKGNDLLEEASMLTQSGNFDEATGYKDLARILKRHLQDFTGRLERTRDKIEDTAKCYGLLDKSYEWALEAMKYVASMKVDHPVSSGGIQRLLQSLSKYLKDHPPVSMETFQMMIDIAHKLNNEKLQDQCNLAKSRSEETSQLLLLRQTALGQALEKLEAEHSDSLTGAPSIPKSNTSMEGHVWSPQSMSTPASFQTSQCRRREISPVHSIDSSSSSHSLTNYQYKDNLYNNGSLTEEVSVNFGASVQKDSSDTKSMCSQQSLDSEKSSSKSSTHSLESALSHRAEHSANSQITHHQMVQRAITLPVIKSTILEECAQVESLERMKHSSTSDGSDRLPKNLFHIMTEMIQTERNYVKALQYVIEYYIPELQRDDVPPALRGRTHTIFGNLEKIYQFHREFFVREVELCEKHPYQLAQYFLLHENRFGLYALYNKNKPKSDALMSEHGKEFFKKKQTQLGDRMDLSSYLLKPVQRMGKYALLLKQILKECPEMDPEYQDLKAAEQMVRFQLRHGNDLLAMDSLRDCDVNLQEQGRLIRQDQFLVWQGRKKSLRHVFLFEELVLFSKTKRGRQGGHDIYLYKRSFKTADIGLTENFGDTGYKFEIWFRRRSLGDNYVLQAANSEVKHAWVKEVSRLLWKQAIRNREVRMSELATMGIGSKPCLDIKPSADNINDRYIRLGPRGARTRNSIAVSSFDHLRNGNKRPHSIISVSSTSSSNSSQSSSAILGSLNLAFDPRDSPHMYRHSLALSSNESGICPDLSCDSDTPPCVYYQNSPDYKEPSIVSPRRRASEPYGNRGSDMAGYNQPPMVTDV